ncbi:hypothetical protein N7E02_00430 (plasmid) [Aliirhizobium terrae]|uniref:hypothetical protein n=1 Tax=Terrirhizobium terrae TaxID=2926709 RepID=UPI002578E54E|nr:hypothetical protein [Rhizobium sp. CC-CFT758]WJH37940.1 hypothetical protein N7E02_00430 [Rhizobium sp. CC-CFT758]
MSNPPSEGWKKKDIPAAENIAEMCEDDPTERTEKIARREYPECLHQDQPGRQIRRKEQDCNEVGHENEYYEVVELKGSARCHEAECPQAPMMRHNRSD